MKPFLCECTYDMAQETTEKTMYDPKKEAWQYADNLTKSNAS